MVKGITKSLNDSISPCHRSIMLFGSVIEFVIHPSQTFSGISRKIYTSFNQTQMYLATRPIESAISIPHVPNLSSNPTRSTISQTVAGHHVELLGVRGRRGGLTREDRPAYQSQRHQIFGDIQEEHIHRSSQTTFMGSEGEVEGEIGRAGSV